MAYDETMTKAAWLHEQIKAMTLRPDLPNGSLWFAVRNRKTRTNIPIRLRYNYLVPEMGVLKFGTAFELPFPRKEGTKLSVHADIVLDEEDAALTIRARCEPKDNARRWMGRTIALMRMARIIGPLGYDVLAVWGKGENAPCIVIPGDVQVPTDWLPAKLIERFWRQQRPFPELCRQGKCVTEGYCNNG